MTAISWCWTSYRKRCITKVLFAVGHKKWC